MAVNHLMRKTPIINEKNKYYYKAFLKDYIMQTEGKQVSLQRYYEIWNSEDAQKLFIKLNRGTLVRTIQNSNHYAAEAAKKRKAQQNAYDSKKHVYQTDDSDDYWN